jgi:putative ABC transport system permease protein
LTRGAERQREFATRLALGAGRPRLFRQLAVEGALLASLGGAAGLLLAYVALRALLGLAPPDLPRLRDASLDSGVLLFSLAAAGAATCVFCLLSAGRTLAMNAGQALTGGSDPRLVGAIGRRRLNLLAGAELALTAVLLVAAGLLLKTLVALVTIDHGFETRGALAAQVSLPSARYPGSTARMAFHDRLLERVRTTSGAAVEIGITTAMPNRQPTGRFDYNAKGMRAEMDPRAMQIAEVRMVTEGFIEAMGLRVVSGRTFDRRDTNGAEPVIVISRALAGLHFPSSDPVGQMLYSHSGTRRVIGVVGDVRPIAIDVPQAPAAYVPIRQSSEVFQWLASVTIVARGQQAERLVDPIRAALRSLDPELPLYNIRTLEADVSRVIAGPRFAATVLAIFAAIALAMAALGVYGVMAYAASQRTREIGLRVALGATRNQVLRLMLRDGVTVVIAGLTAGQIAAWWLSRAMTGVLDEVSPADPLTLGAVAALLTSVGLAAAYVPARRATRVTALDALRHT